MRQSPNQTIPKSSTFITDLTKQIQTLTPNQQQIINSQFSTSNDRQKIKVIKKVLETAE